LGLGASPRNNGEKGNAIGHGKKKKGPPLEKGKSPRSENCVEKRETLLSEHYNKKEKEKRPVHTKKRRFLRLAVNQMRRERNRPPTARRKEERFNCPHEKGAPSRERGLGKKEILEPYREKKKKRLADGQKPPLFSRK